MSFISTIVISSSQPILFSFVMYRNSKTIFNVHRIFTHTQYFAMVDFDQAKFKIASIFFLIALALIIAAIPWSRM